MNLGGQEYTPEQISQWLQGKSQAEIAQQAASMGLNAGEIQSALSAGGQNYTANDINGAAANLGYNFGGAGGDIQQAPAPAAQDSTPGGMTIAGQYYSPQQIKDFYASGGDDLQFAEQHGYNLGNRRDAMLQARAIAGPGTMAGEQAYQHYFKEYQKYNPNGHNANDYENFKKDMQWDPVNRGAIDTGGYTGAAFNSVDFAPGGIYAPGTGHDFTYQTAGLGPRGMGGDWTPGASQGNTWAPQTSNPMSVQNGALGSARPSTAPVGALTLVEKQNRLRKALNLPSTAPIPAEYAQILGN